MVETELPCPTIKNKTSISARTLISSSWIVTPSNCFYVRCTVQKDIPHQLEEGSTPTPYTPFVPNSPSPDYPAPITNLYKAGDYQLTVNGKKYHYTLSQDLESAGSVADRLAVDLGRKECYVKKNVSSGVLDGVNRKITGIYSSSTSIDTVCVYGFLGFISPISTKLCSHLKYSTVLWHVDIEGLWSNGSTSEIFIRIKKSTLGIVDGDTNTVIIQKANTWLSNNFMTINSQLKTPQVIKQSFYEVIDGENTTLTLDNTVNDNCSITIKGNSIQDNYRVRELSVSVVEVVDNDEDHARKVIIEGKTEQKSDWYVANGESSQVSTVQGKNICPTDFSEWESGLYHYTDGTKKDSLGYMRLKKIIKISPSTLYYFNTNANVSNRSIYFAVRTYDSNGVFMSSMPYSSQFGIFGTGINDTYAGISIYDSALIMNITEFESSFINGEIKPFISLDSETDKTYTPFIPNSPSPDYPSPITHSVEAGTYKITTDYGIYEVTLDDDLRGINGVFDVVEVDRVSGKGWLRKKAGHRLFTENDNFGIYNSYINTMCFTNSLPNGASWYSNSSTKSNYFKRMESVIYDYEGFAHLDTSYKIAFHINKSSLSTLDVAGFKNWLSTHNTEVVYQLLTPTRTPLALTKVTTSTAPELPMQFLTNTPSADYYADVYSVGGNLVSRGVNLFSAEDFVNNLKSNLGGLLAHTVTLVDKYTNSFKYATVGNLGNYTTYLEYKFEPNTQYTLSFDCILTEETDTRAYSNFGFIYTDGTSRSVNINETQATRILVSDRNKTIKKLAIGWAWNGVANLSKVQIVEGDVSTPYQPYHNQTTPYQHLKQLMQLKIHTFCQVGSMIRGLVIGLN